MREYRLDGKVAIVTGAGRNIGKGIALCLAEAGADVVTVARTQSEIDETAAEVRALGRRALAIHADVTRAQDVQSMVDLALKEFGQIDILVNNAGGGTVRKLLVPAPGHTARTLEEAAPMSDQEWRSTLDLNLTSAFLCCRAVGPHFLARRKGKVINVTSPTGTHAVPRMLAYCTAKAGLDMFTRALALEWARHGINVNALGPGFVPGRRTSPELAAKIVASLPMHRMSTPREVGLMAVYLASPASDFMTGQVVQVDGGQTLI